MATFVHGRNTYISIASFDMSSYTSKSEFKRGADSHDTTAYGATWKGNDPGLKEASFSCEGTYDSTTNGPHDKLEPLVGTKVALIRRVEGTGTGKPETSCQIVVTGYVESSPVNDMVKWSFEGVIDGAVTEGNQP